MQSLSEELELIKSMYCLPGECLIKDEEGFCQVEVNITHKDDTTPTLKVQLHFSRDYPLQAPDISVVGNDNEQSKKLKKELTDLGGRLQGTAMIMELLSHSQTYVDSNMLMKPAVDVKKMGTEVDELVTALLTLDHMRAKDKYIRTVCKWTADLQLSGRLIFIGRLIIIVLQGRQSSVKEYIKLQRSSNVDVDSHGKKCKERMMSVLHQEKCLVKNRFMDFQVKDCSSKEELKNVLVMNGLSDLFSTYIQSMMR